MSVRRILGGGRARGISFWPLPNSSGWWWLTSSVFLAKTSCCKITHANGYYGAWPGWVVSVSVFTLTVRYFQESILWARFLYLLISRKTLKSFLVTTVPRCQSRILDWLIGLTNPVSRKFHQTSRNLLGKYVLDSMYFSITKITCIPSPPASLEHSFSELSEVLSPGLQSSFLHQIKFNLQLSCSAFF